MECSTTSTFRYNHEENGRLTGKKIKENIKDKIACTEGMDGQKKMGNTIDDGQSDIKAGQHQLLNRKPDIKDVVKTLEDKVNFYTKN